MGQLFGGSTFDGLAVWRFDGLCLWGQEVREKFIANAMIHVSFIIFGFFF